MGLAPEELPEPLRAIALPKERPYGFHRFSLTPELATAAQSILAAPASVRRAPAYAQAKAVELMCLLIDQMTSASHPSRSRAEARSNREARLQEARDLMARRYADALALEEISKEVGLNRMALTSGFRQLLGFSVHDYLRKVRMEQA